MVVADFQSAYPVLSDFIIRLTSKLDIREMARLAWLTDQFSLFAESVDPQNPQLENMKFTILEALFTNYGTENVFEKLSDVLQRVQPQTEKTNWKMMIQADRSKVEYVASNNLFNMQPVHEAILVGLMDQCTGDPAKQMQALFDHMDTSGQLRSYYRNDLSSTWFANDLFIQCLAMFQYYLTELNGGVDGIMQALSQSDNKIVSTTFNAFCKSLNIGDEQTIHFLPMPHQSAPLQPMALLPMSRQPAPLAQAPLRMMSPMTFHHNQAGQKLLQGWLQGKRQQTDHSAIRPHYSKQ